MRALLLLILVVELVSCDPESEVLVDRPMGDYNTCWLVPQFPDLGLEDLESFEMRLKTCQLYYEQFLTRRFSSWGRFEPLIRIWAKVFEDEIQENPISKVHEILTNKPVDLKNLSMRLQITINSVMSQSLWNKYEKMSLVRAYDRGDGICVDLLLPPMDRFWQLIDGIGMIILNYHDQNTNGQGQMSEFMQNFLKRTRDNDILIIHLVQNVCHQASEADFLLNQDNQFIYRNHLGEEKLFKDFIWMWSERVLSGFCEYDSLYAMKLAYQFHAIMENDVYDLGFMRHFKAISNMLIENCLKIVTKNSLILARLDMYWSLGDEDFKFYKTSWEVMHIINETNLQLSESWLSLINIRAVRSHNKIDKLFLESRDPFLIETYTQGKGLCSRYENYFHNMDTDHLFLIRTLDKLVSVRGFQPTYSSRLFAFYLISKICELAYLLPYK